MERTEKEIYLSEQESIEAINRLGMAAVFLSCSDHILDTLEIFKKSVNQKATLSFYAKGLAKEAEKALNIYYNDLDEAAEKRTYRYKDIQEQHLAAFVASAAFPDLHEEYLAHLQAFNQKHGIEMVEDREFMEQYGKV